MARRGGRLSATGAGLSASVMVRLGRFDLEVALEIPDGETVAVVGPNGAGKTTLLRALAGVEPIDGGRVVLDGVVLDDVAAGTHVPAEARPAAMVFQDGLLFPHLSALDNVAFGARCRGAARGDARCRAAEWLTRLGLDGHAHARPAQLSGGQAQRVALARALATEPRLLLLDEPLSSLDATSRAQARHLLQGALAALGGVRVVVTHDPLEAAALAERLLVIEDGRLVQGGTLAAMSAHPRSRFVADLVGVNLLRGIASGDQVVTAGGDRLVVPGAGRGEVVVVVHPRAVALHRRRPEGTPRNVWPAQVVGLETAGDRARVQLGGRLPIVAEVTPGAVAELRLAEGGDVWVSVKATEMAAHPA